MTILLLMGAPDVTPVTVTDNALAIFKAADFSYQFRVMTVAGVGVDITSATFSGMFRWQYADVAPVFDLSASGISIVVAAGGTAKIVITSAATSAAVVPTNVVQDVFSGSIPIYYDINMTLSGVKYRVLRGVAKYYRSALP